MSDETDVDPCAEFDRLLAAGDLVGAEEAARHLDPEWLKAERLAAVARAAVAVHGAAGAEELWEEALAIARKGEQSPAPQDSVDASGVIWEIAEDIALAGHIDRAKGIADGIVNPGKRGRAVHFVSDIAAGGPGSFAPLRARDRRQRR